MASGIAHSMGKATVRRGSEKDLPKCRAEGRGAEGRGAKGSIVHLLVEHQKVELGRVDRNWREEYALENFLPLSTNLYVRL